MNIDNASESREQKRDATPTVLIRLSESPTPRYTFRWAAMYAASTLAAMILASTVYAAIAFPVYAVLCATWTIVMIGLQLLWKSGAHALIIRVWSASALAESLGELRADRRI